MLLDKIWMPLKQKCKIILLSDLGWFGNWEVGWASIVMKYDILFGRWWLGRNWNWDLTGECGTETQMGNHWSTTRNDLLTSHTFLDLSEMEICSYTNTVKTLLSLTRSLKHYLHLYVKWNAHLLNGSVVHQKFVADQINRRLDSWG